MKIIQLQTKEKKKQDSRFFKIFMDGIKHV